jgi:hypothetical protein
MLRGAFGSVNAFRKGWRPSGQGTRACGPGGRGQRAEGRGQRAEGRGQRAEDRGQRTEDRGCQAEGGGRQAKFLRRCRGWAQMETNQRAARFPARRGARTHGQTAHEFTTSPLAPPTARTRAICGGTPPAARRPPPDILCPLPSALCPLPSVLCPLPSALCPLPSALRPRSRRTSSRPREIAANPCPSPNLRPAGGVQKGEPDAHAAGRWGGQVG